MSSYTFDPIAKHFTYLLAYLLTAQTVSTDLLPVAVDSAVPVMLISFHWSASTDTM